MHIALRAAKGDSYTVDGEDVVPAVHRVIDKINAFSDKLRSGQWKGATGKPITAVVAIGIGGSYLGANFVYEAMRTDKSAAKEAEGRELRFLANVDPVGVTRALEGLKPESTLAIVISKTFTTRETMLNARTVRRWFVSELGEQSIAQHMVAVSTNLKDVKAFGINPDNAFEFWDWVGGRYSVTSAVGLLPPQPSLRLSTGGPVPRWLSLDRSALLVCAGGEEPAHAAGPAGRVEQQLPRLPQPCPRLLQRGHAQARPSHSAGGYGVQR